MKGLAAACESTVIIFMDVPEKEVFVRYRTDPFQEFEHSVPV
jgi:hypothetical protein